MIARYFGAISIPLTLVGQEPSKPVPKYEGSVAVGVSTGPDYPGSKMNSMFPALDLSLTWRPKGLGVWQYTGLGFMWRPNEDPRAGVGFVIRGDGGRTDRKATMIQPGNSRLKGMGTVEPTPEIGVVGMIAVGPIPIHAEFRQAISSHKGSVVDVGFDFTIGITENFGIVMNSTATWGDKNTNQAYFGVTASQADQTDYTIHTSEAGWRRIGVFVGASITLDRGIFMKAGLDRGRWIGPAAKSPLMERRDSLAASALVGWSF